MVPAAKVTRLNWDDQARELMQPAAEASPWSLLDSPDSVFKDCSLWQIESGDALGLVALRGLQLPGGRLLEVAGLRSVGARITHEQLQLVEHVARTEYTGVDLVTLTTRYPHLVRGMQRAGWTAVATVMNKPLKVH